MALHRTRERLARSRPSATSSAPPLERSAGQPLDGSVRGALEPRFGHSFANVRVHADAEADRRAREMDARAFTEEGDVFFRQDAYAPGTAAGEHLLAHELTHVVQHERFGTADGPALSATHDAAEAEARAAADAVLTGASPVTPSAAPAAISLSPNDDDPFEFFKNLPFKPILPGEPPDPRDDPQAERQREWDDWQAERRGDKYPNPLGPKPVDPRDPHKDPLYWKDWGRKPQPGPQELQWPDPEPLEPGDYPMPQDDPRYA